MLPGLGKGSLSSQLSYAHLVGEHTEGGSLQLFVLTPWWSQAHLLGTVSPGSLLEEWHGTVIVIGDGRSTLEEDVTPGGRSVRSAGDSVGLWSEDVDSLLSLPCSPSQVILPSGLGPAP